MDQPKPSPLLYPALTAIQVLFGINFIASKIVVDILPPILWASARLAVCSVLMVAACVLLKRPHPPRARAFFLGLLPFALMGAVVNQGALLLGLRYTTATNSAVLMTLIPIVTLVIVTLRGQEALTLRRGLGFLSALAGVLLLRRLDQLSLSDQTMKGDLLVVLSCVSTAMFFSYGKKFSQTYDRFWATAWMFIYGTIGLGLLAIPDLTDLPGQAFLMSPSPALIGSMAFTIVGGTLLTYFLSVWTLAQAPPSSVAFFSYVQPVVTAAIAWIWFDQPVTGRMILSCVLIFTGLLLSLAKKPAAGVIIKT